MILDFPEENSNEPFTSRRSVVTVTLNGVGWKAALFIRKETLKTFEYYHRIGQYGHIIF